MTFHLLLLGAALLGLTACAGAPRLHGSAAQERACRARADEIYLKQNRADIYRADAYATSGKDAPFAGAGRLDAPSLSDQYARDQILDACLNGAGDAQPGPSSETAVTPTQPKTAPPPPPPVP
jgi:hypothetical protein